MFIHESLIVIQLHQLTHGRLILFFSCIIFYKCFNQTLNSVIPTLNMAWKVKVKSLSPIWLFATLWTVARQAPWSMEFSRQELLEWVAISFSNTWKWKVKLKSLSCVRLLATPWTAAYQAPPSMGFSRQKYWSGVPLKDTFPLEEKLWQT